MATRRLSNVLLRNLPRLSALNTGTVRSSGITTVHRNITSSSVVRKEMLEVTFETGDGASYTVKGREGDNLLDVIVNNDVDLDGFGACEGTLSCSTCHLIFKQEDFDQIDDPCTDEELDMLDLAYGLTDTPLWLSLSGGGFLGVYLVGALECLGRFSPHYLKKAQVFGVSAGSLLGASLVCNVPLDGVKFAFLRAAADAQEWVMGPFSPGFKFESRLCKGLDDLPSDAHIRASGRLHVSLTHLPDMTNVTLSHWDTREELIETLRASCFILGFTGMKPPVVKGERYIDGGYSNINKEVDLGGKVVSVSPFCGDAIICPEEVDEEATEEKGKLKLTKTGMDLSFTNAIRVYRTFMPPPPHILNEYYYNGYLDTYKYLKNQRKQRVLPD